MTAADPVPPPAADPLPTMDQTPDSTTDQVPASPQPAPRPVGATKQWEAERRAARAARWQEAHTRRTQGQTIGQIARELGHSRRAIRRLLATPQPPHNRRLHPRPAGLASPTLQPYVTYLQDRWQHGCTNGSQLYREVVTQGYTGSCSLLLQALRSWRPSRPPPGQRHTRCSVRWLCLRPPDQLSADDQTTLTHLLNTEPDLARGYDLLQRFRRLIATRDYSALETWLRDAQASALAPFVACATGMWADRSAVEAALTLPYSQGPIEGHIHRVKLLKRLGYGRAKLDLLRCRVLASGR